MAEGVQEILMDRVALWAFLAYLLCIIAIGFFSSRFSSKGISEYFVGGRKINRFVVGLSAVVSGRSAWLLIGFTGMAYTIGAAAIWAVVGYIVVEVFLFFHYARRLRRYAEVKNCITVPDFFASRFPREALMLRLVMVSVILIFMAGYVAAQFVAGGKTFSSAFGIGETSGLLLTAGIVLIYTVVGGFLAVSLTDVLQAILMILSLMILPIILIVDLGGYSLMAEALSALDPNLVDPFALTIGAMIASLGIGLGSPGNPHIISRYISIENEKQLITAGIVGTFWNILMAAGAFFIGFAGKALLPEVEMLPAGDAENLFVYLASQYLPSFLFGLVIASVFAAIMSSADSQLLVAASGVVRDFFEKVYFRKRTIQQAFLVRMSRITVFVLVLGALIMGILAEDLVFWLVLFAWAGLGAAIGPASLLALYWRGTTGAGILAAMISGTIVTIVWRLTPALREITYELIPGFAIALVLGIVVSLLTKRPEGNEEDFAIMKGDKIVLKKPD
ncbi:MAG: sodium/proline symporter [Saprospirales bacterium]|nr:MAG: sodium/proline symporter [Saprospirales bacterium]